ncbi:hypothetical protein OQA88_2750 [Cercophora sp. LCS_1]
MSRAKVARSNLLELVDSDSDDGLGGNNYSIAKPVAAAAAAAKTSKNQPAMPPKKAAAAAKGAAGRQAANKVTKPAPPKATTRRGSGRAAAAALEAAAEEESRTALAEKPTNAQPKAPVRGRKKAAPAPEPEQEDTVMEDATEEPVTKPRATRGRPKKTVEDNAPKEAPAPKGRLGRKKVQPVVEEGPEEAEDEPTEIPETQQPGARAEAEEMEEDETELPPPTRFSDPVEPSRQASLSSPSKRPSYPSDSGGEPALRRRLGEMTQKYEGLEAKYRDLREVAVREAERNFDRLKTQTEDKAKAADQLIASLKAELAARKEEAKEVIQLRKQLEASEARADDLQTRVAGLTKSLAESKTEIKSLNMKLTAARSAEASAVASIKVPNSAMKGSTAAIKGAVASSQQATLSAQMKEDLYADLTGLIMRSAKRESSDDVYDCIQTGRNGTLHFKLEIPNDASGESFEDAQFRYTPMLDPSRDRPLIEILPDFLVEEITFPRPHAIKFYARVMKALTEAPPPPESPE